MEVLAPECKWPSDRNPASAALTPHRGLSVGHGADRRRTVLGFVGDLMLGRRVSSVIGTRPPESFWGNVLPFLRNCDGVVGNLESPITTQSKRWSKTWKAFHFRAVPAATTLLTTANIRLVNLANNHIMDFGERGAIDTRQHLAAAGIAFAGAGGSSIEALSPALCRIGGICIGFVGLTDNMQEWAANGHEGGTNYAAIRCNHATRSLIRLLAKDLRAAGADCVVLSIHWGRNLRTQPSREYRKFARSAIEDGVDIVHGHSAHLIQGIEVHGRGVIMYDTGDFMSDYWVFPGFRTDRSALFLVELVDRGPVEVSAIPVSLSPAQVKLARGREFDAICRCLTQRCRNLGTESITNRSGVNIAIDIGRGASPRAPIYNKTLSPR
jgi:poly-gamma-glutamate synthesis protein (capsule biosynthesis protein)